MDLQLDMPTAEWLKKNSLQKRLLTIFDALAPTAVRHEGKFVPIIGKMVYAKVFDDILPHYQVTTTDNSIRLVNPGAARLDSYEKKLLRVLALYRRRRNGLLQRVLTDQHREEVERLPIADMRRARLDSLAPSYHASHPDIALMDKEIATGEEYLEISTRLREEANAPAAKPAKGARKPRAPFKDPDNTLLVRRGSDSFHRDSTSFRPDYPPSLDSSGAGSQRRSQRGAPRSRSRGGAARSTGSARGPEKTLPDWMASAAAESAFFNKGGRGTNHSLADSRDGMLADDRYAPEILESTLRSDDEAGADGRGPAPWEGDSTLRDEDAPPPRRNVLFADDAADRLDAGPHNSTAAGGAGRGTLTAMATPSRPVQLANPAAAGGQTVQEMYNLPWITFSDPMGMDCYPPLVSPAGTTVRDASVFLPGQRVLVRSDEVCLRV